MHVHRREEHRDRPAIHRHSVASRRELPRHGVRRHRRIRPFERSGRGGKLQFKMVDTAAFQPFEPDAGTPVGVDFCFVEALGIGSELGPHEEVVFGDGLQAIVFGAFDSDRIPGRDARERRHVDSERLRLLARLGVRSQHRVDPVGHLAGDAVAPVLADQAQFRGVFNGHADLSRGVRLPHHAADKHHLIVDEDLENDRTSIELLAMYTAFHLKGEELPVQQKDDLRGCVRAQPVRVGLVADGQWLRLNAGRVRSGPDAKHAPALRVVDHAIHQRLHGGRNVRGFLGMRGRERREHGVHAYREERNGFHGHCS